MSIANTTLNDLGLTSKSSATSASSAEMSGCGGNCNCTCGANDSAEETTSSASVASGTTTAEYLVTGMTCSHCVLSVTEEMFDLDGVQNVSIELNAEGISKVSVQSAAPLNVDEVRAAITTAGYELVPAV